MKTICVICKDTAPLPLNLTKIKSLSPSELIFFKNQYMKCDYSGIRAWKIAEVLSKEFEVLFLLPEVYYPKDFILTEQLKFKVETYNYKIASWNWSEELERKLKNSNFVIIQSDSGVGVQNCSFLPKNINLIVDGIKILPLELSGHLLTYSKIARKVYWKKAISQYKDLIDRSNCLLVGNDKQRYFYEGLFYGTDKLDYSTFQFSTMLKVPFGIENRDITIRDKKDNSLNLLYLGPIEPWDCPEVLIKNLSEHKDINIDFVNLKHPRHPKSYTTYFKSFFDNVHDISNINMFEKEIELLDLSKYDFAVVLSRNWIYESYIHKENILNLLSFRLPVITNMGDSLYEESPFLRQSMYTINVMTIKEDLEKLLKEKQNYIITEEVYEKIKETFNWDNSLLPLIKYIRNF